MRERLTMLNGRFAPLMQDTDWGPGRNDTFNPNKILFNFPIDQLPERERSAPVDFPSIWLQKPRQGMQLHWDGNNIMAEERNKNAAFGTGTTPPTIDLAAIGRLEQWLLTAEPPKYPYPIDATKASRGAALYAEYCAGCHGADGRTFSAPAGTQARECVNPHGSDDELYGPQVGKITRIEYIGTDRHRLDSFSYDLAANLGDGLRRLPASLLPLSQDLRLREHAARRHLAACAVSAQRLGAHAARAARAGVKTSVDVLSRQ